MNLVKAHFFLGQALLEQENYDEALASLKRGKKSIILMGWLILKLEVEWNNLWNNEKVE